MRMRVPILPVYTVASRVRWGTSSAEQLTRGAGSRLSCPPALYLWTIPTSQRGPQPRRARGLQSARGPACSDPAEAPSLLVSGATGWLLISSWPAVEKTDPCLPRTCISHRYPEQCRSVVACGRHHDGPPPPVSPSLFPTVPTPARLPARPGPSQPSSY